ncbi:hypothetical protein Micbo1qcDRAFT_124031 [Microdochium bolleyi]|uniref:WSC domain-containing protein n=1 Tax=Microdochium bolleyi TaxID=196109 RepID=A0A136ISY6_9PEZI|nr:hypothetical protein Micbo1qcDRAFT_124031 [Microdochium bolleyi]
MATWKLASVLLLSLAGISSAQLQVPATLPGNWTYQHCWSDVGRTIEDAFTSTNNMTIESCLAFCQQGDYPYAGVEYFNQCFCGLQLASGAAQQSDDSSCNTPCNGNSTEPCGGPNRLTLFHNPSILGPQPDTGITNWPYLGCYSEGSNGGRTFPFSPNIDGNSMSGQVCTSACQAAGYILAGTEYSSQCFCGNDTMNGGAPATSGCVMRCSGSDTEICGGGDRLSVYSFMGRWKPDNGGSGSSSSSMASSATATSWTSYGCWQDGPGPRILPQYQAPDNSNMTRESCIQLCSSMNYTISGTEYYRQCFCGNAIYNGGKQAPDESGCQTACSGDSSTMCGGAGYLSIYSEGTPKIFQPPAVKTSGLNGTWEYKGCYTSDNTTTGVHNLPWQLQLPDTNSAELCLGLCAEYGYAAAGLEYGIQCFCGDPWNVVAGGEQQVDESRCSIACSGSPQELCGGQNVHSLYYWNGTQPLYKFNYPTGNDMGAYSFLVGGLVVPLMTMQSITGKVTFLEKFGTGPPNSTGAYELDLTLVDNFDLAWREMHVKSDIFCSAGLILPDKAARQLTVGGWSLESTFGVRLYWPDGSPGVNGTHDWQENANELTLQSGRWYPSAMVMTNGSILVVGGERGSNDIAVPSLEILPYTGSPPVYLDWLERTNPNNLYPFLSVLPSGGIFVQYWNEARILDEVTLQTIKVLPNATGAVTDPLAGRTYPLEGTSVLMPQVAPYTDPLTVMVCGGATTNMVALDNCVSIQPDAANPQWVLERMPSKRVMTCIAPLPDGTYLILNGAQQGVAGFGLASDPNLEAVLYDPGKPVGQRMSIMASTIVARLYHSEAITLLDGRVLVSGSDPEDNKNPEEYRIEVFTPPYLLNSAGSTRPAFTVPANSKDWAYSGQYTVNINSTAVGGAGSGQQKFSLLGAVSSTHGNSMGARTLFPAFSCMGNSCVITAPPSKYIAPPGWYQLFYLVDGVPAVGTYVRIGGDPGNLGNWPAYPDFTVPGV